MTSPDEDVERALRALKHDPTPAAAIEAAQAVDRRLRTAGPTLALVQAAATAHSRAGELLLERAVPGLGISFVDAAVMARRTSPDLTEAARHLLAAARHDPHDAHTLLLLGSVALATGDHEAARTAVGAGRPAEPEHAAMLGTLYACLAAYDPGTPEGRRLSILRAALGAPPSLMRPPALLALGTLLTTRSEAPQDLAEGVDALVELMEQAEPGDPEFEHAVILVLAAMCRHLTVEFPADFGRLAAALPWGARDDLTLACAAACRSRVEREPGHLTEAARHLRKAVERSRPDDREMFLLAGAGLVLFYDRFVAEFSLVWLNAADRCCDILEALPYGTDVSAMRRAIAEQRSA
ncbi:tetratricopeptide repeat protein [Herbidospora yilanensis]|uniref:tetratricopeptide repeat protein n=1 Tax=Herbidospora yilanensis TaxID=354426 RepID=UPI0007813C32|nr:tetratricopeptide repeat protein [Herbidospora yilanensis]